VFGGCTYNHVCEAVRFMARSDGFRESSVFCLVASEVCVSETRRQLAVSCRGRVHRCELGLKPNRSGRCNRRELQIDGSRIGLDPRRLLNGYEPCSRVHSAERKKRTIFWRKRMVFSLRAFVYRVGRTKCTKLRSRVPRSSFKNFAIRPAS
jgi:hypothetical protein